MIPAGGISWREAFAFVAALWLAGAAPGVAEEKFPIPEPLKIPPVVAETLAGVIGDSRVVSCFVCRDAAIGQDKRSIPWADYELATAEGKRWSLRISGPLDSEAEAQAKFRVVSMIASVGPNEWEYGEGYELEGWNRPGSPYHHVLFRRGTSMASVAGELPYALVKDKAGMLDRLLQASTLPRQVAEAGWASEATIYMRTHPAPTPTPVPHGHE